MNIKLNENERIDDLQLNNLKIIQNKECFCFGIDSVLLSDFAKDIKKDSEVLDLGTGTGIQGILLCGKTELRKIYGIEVQKSMCDMAQKSIKLNSLENRFEIINKNIIEIDKIFKENSIDAIVTNPPYKKIETGIKSKDETKLISRHEILASLEDFIKISSKLLKNSGSFYMVHRPERLSEIIYLLKKYNLEPKKIKMVQSYKNSKPKLILIKAIKDAKEFLDIESPLIIYEEKGKYSKDILKIYNKE